MHRVSQGDSFSRPRPPHKRSSSQRLSTSPLDHDDYPPPYDSSNASSNDQSDSGASGSRGPKSRMSTSPTVLEEYEDLNEPHGNDNFGVEDIFSSDAIPVTPPSHPRAPANLHISTDYHESSMASSTSRRDYSAPIATPQRMSRLEDMNADLQERIDELNEQIQDDAEMSQHQVRRLEKELVNLRAELAYTRERNEQLEAARVREAEDEERARELKRQRTEKLRAARYRRLTHGLGPASGSDADLGGRSGTASPRIRDFAPKGTTSPADLQRLRSPEVPRTTSGDPASDTEDPQIVESPTGLASPRELPNQLPSSSLSFMDQLTDIERATIEMQRSPSQSSTKPQSPSPVMQPSPLLPPPPPITTADAAQMIPEQDYLPASLSRALSSAPPRRKSTGVSQKTKRALQRVALGNKAMLAMTSKPSLSPPASLSSDASSSPFPPKGKGKSRASLTDLSFVPPSPEELSSPTTAVNPNSNRPSTSSTLFPSRYNTLSSDIGSASSSTFQHQQMASPSLNGLGSPFPDFSNLGPLSPNESLRSRLGMARPGELDHLHINAPTLGSELLGHEHAFGAATPQGGQDWRAEFENDMFGDLDLTELMSPRGEHVNVNERDDTAGSALGLDVAGSALGGSMIGASSAAIDALSSALDPMHKGELREADDHILPLGSLREAPNETFYLLDKAVGARPVAWTDISPLRALESARATLGQGVRSRAQRLLGSATSSPPKSPGTRPPRSSFFPLGIALPLLRITEDAWSLYPDEDTEALDEVTDSGSEEREPAPYGSRGDPELILSPRRRELALERMSRTRSHRLSISGEAERANALRASQRASHRSHHTRNHRRPREEPQSILRSFAERLGVPASFVPTAIPGQTRISARHTPYETEEFGEDDETEVDEDEDMDRASFGVGVETSGLTDDEGGESEFSAPHHHHQNGNSALVRLRGTSTSQSHSPTDDHTGTDEDRYNTSAIAHKLQSTSMNTIVQAWMGVQFVALVVVFVYFAAKRGPTAIIKGGLSGGATGSSGGHVGRVRSSRGAGGGGLVSRRQ